MRLPLFTRFKRLCSALRYRVSQFGPGFIFVFFWLRFKTFLREKRLGIDTRGWIGSGQLGDDPQCHDYEALDFGTIDLTMGLVPFNSGSHSLLDYGCGKGRIVACAASYPFKRILGVEWSQELCELARRNVAHYRGKRLCSDTQIIQADAAKYEVPGDVSVIYLFNPFSGAILEAAAKRVEESLEKSPRAAIVYHIHPAAVPSPFSKSKILKFKKQLPLIYRAGMVLEMFCCGDASELF